MRVLFINTVFGKGSTGRIIKELGEAIEETGGEYKVAYGRGEVTDQEHTYFIGSKADRYIHAGLSRITDRAGFFSKGCTNELIGFIREYSPDIIHLHNLHGYYINLPVLFKYLSVEFKGKVVWTLHDCWAFTGHCTYYSFAKCDAWKNECKNCPQKNEYPTSILVDSSKKNQTEKLLLINAIKEKLTVVTVSEWLKGEVEKSQIRCSDLLCIHNGIDVDRFRPVQSSVRTKYNIGNKYMFLCVSDGWDTRKGIETVIELSKKIDDNSCIVMIGLDKTQLKELPDNIIGMERTWNQDELVEFYSTADVLFNPSKEETFGLVTAEAMACGTPAIVFNVTACPEIVGNNKCGYVIKESPYDKNAIEKNLSNCYLDKQKYSDSCRERVVEAFSKENMKNGYLTLYTNLVEAMTI